MAGITVIAALTGLVGATKADQIQCNNAMPGSHQRRDHFAVEVGPAGLTVHQQHRISPFRALVQVVQAQFAALTIGHIQVVGCEIVARQVFKAFVRRSQNFHSYLLVLFL